MCCLSVQNNARAAGGGESDRSGNYLAAIVPEKRKPGAGGLEWSGGTSGQIDAVDGDVLVEFEDDSAGAPGVIRLREFVCEALEQVAGAAVCFFGFFVAAVGFQHIREDGLAVDGLVEGLRGAGSVGEFGGVFLVELGFSSLSGHFGLALPIAAELVVDEFMRRRRGRTSGCWGRA